MASCAATRAPVKVPRSLRKGIAGTSASDIQLIHESAELPGKVVKFHAKDAIFTQGSPTRNAYYIQEGGVKLSVINENGKEAVVAILGPGNFLGEGCLVGQSLCIATATAIAPTIIHVLEKSEIFRLLHEKHEFFDNFVEYILARHIRVEADLIDQLFNLSEKRLARTLLLLARIANPDKPEKVVAKISQGTLAEMVGTTRSRVNFFMNKFRKLGFVEYSGDEIHINSSLLNVVLHE